jgi:hypothetical protein
MLGTFSGGQRWNVTPQFLQLTAPEAFTAPGNSNVIETSRKNKPSQ